MHLLATSSTSLDDIVEPVDLGQPPGDIAVLSFADSDLAGLERECAQRGASAGRKFWGCTRFPACRGTPQIAEGANDG